jgi:hypothetical protein
MVVISIKVLLADGAATLQMTAALKPDVLLLELYFDDEREYPVEVGKAQVLLPAKYVLAISFCNDTAPKYLAESQRFFSTKPTYSELIPAMRQFRPKVTVLKTTKRSMKVLNPSTSPIEATPEAA